MRQFAAVLSFSAHSRAFRLFLLGVGAVLVVAALTTAAGAQPADVNVISDDVIGVNQTTSAHRQQPETTIAVDPHSPGQFRAIGPHVNLQQFYDAFDIKAGSPMWRTPELRAKIW